MSWDWRAVKDNRFMAADSSANQETVRDDGRQVSAPAGSTDDIVWRPLMVDSAGQARVGASAAGKLLHETTYQCPFCRGQGERPPGTICPICRRSGVVSLAPPVVTCGYCCGRGEVPPRSGITCTVCRGKGKVSVKEPIRTCPSCRGRGRKIGAALYCIQCKGVGVISLNGRGRGRSSRASVLPTEREALEAIAEAGGRSGKTAVGRSMGVSSLYADQLCIKLAGKGLLKERDRGIYALTDSGKAAVRKAPAAHTPEVRDV